MKIDFVITWVDEKDIIWQKEKEKYQEKRNNYASGNVRYRDWDLLKYWFRGIQDNAYWVNKIHFVTYGHIPVWLDTSHPRLNVVKHSDFIPNEFLPTFSSHVIELNLHRIKGLADNFVYFNDDMFLIDKVSEEDFFIDNLPCDEGIFYPILPRSYDIDYSHYTVNECAIINQNFNFNEQIELNYQKYINKIYEDQLERNINLRGYKVFPGFYTVHLPQPFKKETFFDVWEKEGDILYNVSLNKFRSLKDVSQSIFRYWSLIKGEFYPTYYRKKGTVFNLYKDMEKIRDFILKKERKMICLNDSPFLVDIKDSKNELHDIFEKVFPYKSEYEK